jgi:type II restriction/modification system DNA methylase subunit YeeA
MYLEKGYNTKDIPALILKNNLFGLDVDKRAAQLAQFSLIMKARSIDNRFFNEDRFVRPRVFEIIDSTTLTNSNYKECMKSLHFSDASIKIAEYLDKEFEHAKVIGSLLQLEQKDYAVLMDDIKRCREVEIPNLLEYPFFYEGINCLKQLVRLAMTLTKKYDVMITNPPYIGLSTLEAFPKKYLGDRYPNSKTDMFAMFMETNFVKKNGFLAMINMHSWMFLSSYEKLRKHIIQTQCIYNMLHLGAHAFETIGGEVVQTTSFVIRNCAIPSNGVYFRLVDEKDKEAAFLAGGGFNNES